VRERVSAMSEGILSRGSDAREGGQWRRLLVPLVVVLAALAVVELVVQLVLMPRLVVRSVVVTSDLPLSEEDLLQIAGVGGNERYLSIDAAEIERRLEAYPMVKDASVEKAFPDTLRLTVTGRKPLAVSLGRSGDRTVPVVFDEDGVVFQIGGSGSGARGVPDLPVISGLSFVPALGITLPPMLRPLLRDLAQLRAAAPELYGLISEIRVSAVNSVDYELDFFPVGRRVRVRLANRIDETMLRYVFLVMDVLGKSKNVADAAEIDLRSGEVVYRERGAQAELRAGR
jgi:cell division protein FtsQ